MGFDRRYNKLIDTVMLSSMWVSRTMMLTSVLMMLISNSASNPKGQNILPDDDDAFLELLDPPTGCNSSLSETCVLIDKCCDSKPTDTVDDGNTFLDIATVKLSPCSALQICCVKKCMEVEPSVTMKTLIPNDQCGIRNIEGFRVTLTGTDHESQYGEFPWMVAVLKQVDNGYVGGGSLVHKRVVLTAAHKVHDKSDFVARIGDWDISDKTDEEFVAAQTIKVIKVIPHPEFSRQTLTNNVALLIMESDAVLGETVMPICLPDPGDVFDELDCIVTGWGKNEHGSGQFQKVLKKVTVPAVNHNECQSMLRNTALGQNFILHNTLNCAGGEGEDSCEGDGGSPLICPKHNKPHEYVQMGVTAWGIGCGIVGNPGVYGSVPKAVDWINKVLQDEGLTVTIKQNAEQKNPRG